MKTNYRRNFKKRQDRKPGYHIHSQLLKEEENMRRRAAERRYLKTVERKDVEEIYEVKELEPFFADRRSFD